MVTTWALTCAARARQCQQLLPQRPGPPAGAACVAATAVLEAGS